MRTDEELVRQIRRGETAAFDDLYRRYHARLFGYILRLVGERALAEDLFQEVFLTVLRDDAMELRPGRFGSWLFTVARNRALSALRGSQRRAERLESLSAQPAAPPASPEEISARGERLAELRTALCTLSEVHQDVLILKEVGNLTYREIADIQQVPEGTAKSRLHFAIKALRRVLRE